MYEHSIKVPRLYKTAARIAQKVKEDGSSLKQLVYEKKHPNIKALYALVLETLRNDDNLNSIIRHSQLLRKENRLDPWLARVLITELLWGKKKLPGESKPIKTVLSYQDEFLKDFVPEKKNKLKSKKVIKPKYVRINTLKMTVEDAIDNFRNDGWSLVRCGDGSDYSAFLATSASLSEEQFMIDTLVKDLLIFPPGSQFYEHPLYRNGCFVLQDKSSCLAPLLLNPPKGAKVLDMCAAPGMKCMQLASIVENTGKVFAVERDQRRFETLKTLVATADATNVKPINKDVLTLTDSDVPNIEYILVDPSCSGSGMLDRVEFEDEKSHCNESRLEKLAGFQITILRHALCNFKSVKKVVYSTCSIFAQENEQVVQQAITSIPDFKLVPLNEQLKNKWYNFGSDEYNIGPKCLYAKPEIDRTNGFFIAVFERLQEGEKNEYFVKRVKRTSECENINENEHSEENGKGKKKNKQKQQKNEHSNNENIDEDNTEENHEEREETEETHETQKSKKKNKKKRKDKVNKNNDDAKDHSENNMQIDDQSTEENQQKKKKKKKANAADVSENTVSEIESSIIEEVVEKVKKKKKKSKTNDKDTIEVEIFDNKSKLNIEKDNEEETEAECVKQKKKKKKRDKSMENPLENNEESTKKKKKTIT